MYQATFALFGVKIYQATLPYSVSKYTRQHKPYSGVKIYQATFALFGIKMYKETFALYGNQDVPGTIRPIRCQNTPGIRLIKLSSFTKHSPLYGCHVLPFMYIITSSRAIQVSSYQILTIQKKNWGKK